MIAGDIGAPGDSQLYLRTANITGSVVNGISSQSAAVSPLDSNVSSYGPHT